MVTTKLNLSMTEPQVRQIYAKQGDTGRVLDITLDQTPEDGTLRILRPDGTEVTSEAVTGGEVSESGETVTFDSLTEADVTELTVGIEPVQDLSHGDPSPTNICPITGHDEVRVTDVGKNLLDPDVFVSGRSQYYNVNSDGSINVVANDSTAWNDVPYIPLKSGTYTLSWATQPRGQLRMKTSDDGYSAESYIGAGNKRYTFTLTDDGGIKLKIGINASYPYTEYLQLELGSTATAYEPYQGSTYTTSLGQTVYGGTLDMVTGVLTVTHAIATISNFGTLTNYTSSGGLYYSQYSVNSVAEGASISSMLTQKTTSGGYSSTTECFSNEGNRLRVYTNATTDASFRTKFADLQIVYPLTTPTVINLTPQQIKTLVGTNNVWASSGDIVSIKFSYGGLLSELPSEATEIVGKCYCDVEQNGVSSMPFTLNVKKNERAT